MAWVVGDDPNDPQVAVQAMARRIALVVSACHSCDATDELIAAALGQNGPGFTQLEMGQISSKTSIWRKTPDGSINWEGYFNSQHPSPDWPENYREIGYNNYNTKFMLLLYYNDLMELHKRDCALPKGVDWTRIRKIIGLGPGIIQSK